MSRTDRKIHSKFVEYQQFIVDHPNYSGIPEPRGADGTIRWVTAGESALGQQRKQWWLNKGKTLKSQGLNLPEHAQLSPIALAIHPTKRKVCQTCGTELSLEYVYLTKRTIQSSNNALGFNLKDEEVIDVFELIKKSFEEYGSKAGLLLERPFPGSSEFDTLSGLCEFIRKEYVESYSKKLSPGAMSNCPDRLDGFHSYNKCCRANQDTGRSADNLSKYGEDRRAYENWVDGDWKAASWLMKVFNKHNLSADHIGPISLGFCHRPVFQPMSKQQNSSKGNRLTYSDVRKLIFDEECGHQVVSWHSKAIWDALKKEIYDDASAQKASRCMRQNMHDVLTILAILKTKNMREFLLSFLHPEYALFSEITVVGFDPRTGSYKEIIKEPGNKTQNTRNAERYIRIAFEQLDKYVDKANRKTSNLDADKLVKIADAISREFQEKGEQAAKEVLKKLIANNSERVIKELFYTN